MHTIDGRETAPAAMPPTRSSTQETGKPDPVSPRVTSGLSVGTPGTPATWQRALDPGAVRSLGRCSSRPSGWRGTASTSTRPSAVRPQRTRRGSTTSRPPRSCSCRRPRAGPARPSRNPDLAAPTRCSADAGPARSTTGDLPGEIVAPVQQPARQPGRPTGGPARRSTAAKDLKPPTGPIDQAPTTSTTAGSTSTAWPVVLRRSTVGEALNILEGTDLSSGVAAARYLHHYIEASRIAFADRGALGRRPQPSRTSRTKDLLSERFADSRDCLIRTTHALKSPVGAGDVRRTPARAATGGTAARPRLRRREHQTPPDGRRQVGQRRRVHADDRVDGRQRHHRPRPGLPAQQRADGLLVRPGEPRRPRPEPARAGQAAAVVRSRRRSCWRTTSRSWRSAHPAARPSSRPSCRR